MLALTKAAVEPNLPCVLHFSPEALMENILIAAAL